LLDIAVKILPLLLAALLDVDIFLAVAPVEYRSGTS